MNKKRSQRRVLLVEPDYKNKYPPLGLMKLATYHRELGDYVRFFKGDLRKLVVDQYSDVAVSQFELIDKEINWDAIKNFISDYIQYGRQSHLEEISKLSQDYNPSIASWLKYFHREYRKGLVADSLKWDRVCITSLFTFHFNKTIETIEFCKRFVSDSSQIFIGGVMASLIPDEIERATGIKPTVGLLDKPGVLDKGNRTIIDELPPDYSILEEIDYVYPDRDAYYGYTSRGCVRKCDFCAVPTLEPEFKDYLSVKSHLKYVDKVYGARRNLLLLDNNVLASKEFPRIIDEIRKCGFVPGAKFVSPNFLDIAVENLKKGVNDFAYRRLAQKIIIEFKNSLAGDTRNIYTNLLDEYSINSEYLASAQQLINIYNDISELYEERRNKFPKTRCVDFNQGVDARLITDEKMALLASIPIRPLRIAFDSMKYAEPYENALRLADKYNIRFLSNYLLYNFKDKPIDLYLRMKLNVELSEELNLQIYSFPMRYSPIWDDNDLHHSRNFIGKYWNKKFIRSVQTVLNATKGKVGTKLDFFKAAFGNNEEEFFEILYMPEAYIFNRRYFEKSGLSFSWNKLFKSLSASEKEIVFPVIESNNFDSKSLNNKKLETLLEHYKLTVSDFDDDFSSFDRLLNETNKYLPN